MYKFHFQPVDGYLGDCMPFYWKGCYHIFYLKAALKNVGVENLIWSHIKSDDMLHWEELPDALCPSEDTGAIDRDGCWSGSVIHHEGKFYIFYTGVRGLGTEHFQQTICLAQSDDLVHFHKSPHNPILSIDSRWYSIAWADPFVFWNEKEKAFWMLINSQSKNGIRTRSGCIGLAKSIDLKQWQVHEPFYSPNTVPYPEVPEIFDCNGKWYLLYSETADFCCTHYRLADSINGPWQMPAKLDSFDTSELYAIKTIFDCHHRYGLGWVRRKQGNKDEGMPLWGGALGIARKLIAKDNGALKVYYPDSFESIKGPKEILMPRSVYGELESSGGNFKITADSNAALALCRVEQGCFYFRCDITVSNPDAYFGFIFRANENLSNAYRIRFEQSSKRMIAQRLGSEAGGVFNSPLELAQRPMPFAEQGRFEFEMFVDMDIVELFVNRELAMSFRAYEQPGKGFIFFVEQGQAEFRECAFFSSPEVT